MVWLRKFRIYLISTVAIVLIALAVVFSILRALLPHATAYVAEIETQISDLIGLPVSIETLDADMDWLRPRLKLINLVIYKNEQRDVLIAFTEADFSLAFIDSVRYMMPMAGEISLHGADITIERHPQNIWTVQGFEFSSADTASDSDELIEVLLNMNLALLDSHVHWRDYTGRSQPMDFDNAGIVIESFLGNHYVQADLNLPQNLGSSLQLIAEISGDMFNPQAVSGSVYVNGRSLELDNWVNHSRLRDYVLADGDMDVEFWIDVNAGKLNRAVGSVEARNTQLSCADGRDRTWRADKLAGDFFWRDGKHGWRADVRELKIDRDGDHWPYASNASLSRDQTGWSVIADYLRPRDLYELADIFVQGKARQRFDELLAYRLQGDVFNLQATVSADEPGLVSAAADFSDLGFSIETRRVAVQGLDGAVQLRPGHIRLNLESKDVELTLASVFRQPLWFDGLTGEYIAQQQDGHWTLVSDHTRVWNADIDTVSDIRAEIGADGAVFLDMLSSYRNAVAVAARKYLPVAVLSDGLVDWLDKALLGGRVASGGFVFRGDVTHFPFDANDGVMLAAFHAEDTTLHFLAGWPDIHRLDGDVRFFNSSLQIGQAKSREDSGATSAMEAEIADLSAPVLNARGTVTADADEVQDYIWNSGLNSMLGTAMAQFNAQGETRIDLELAVPLGHDAGSVQSRGQIQFVDNELYFPAMDYQLTALNGKLEFDGERLQGNGLQALFDGRTVSIDVSDITRPTGHETHFDLQGDWPVSSLLSKFDWHYPQIMDGGSRWEVSLQVPHRVDKYAARVIAESDLKGVTLTLSDTITKSPQQARPFRLDVEILGDAIQLQAGVADLLNLRARRGEKQHWNFVADSAFFSGKGAFRQDFGTDSTITLELDHIELSAFRRTRGAQASGWSLAPEAIPSLKLKTASLTWDNWTIANVSALTEWHPRGMVISELRVDDAAVNISGKGNWLRRSWQQQTESDISLDVSSSNIGDLLARLGYPRYVDGSDLSAKVNWNWKGAPYSFDWGLVEGSSSIALDQGVISDISPGTGGRLLGLFNLLHLPKRLSLDFEDVYKKGFVFDSVKGSYVLANGEAVTQDTEILASAADITMMGSIGLDDQDYDLVTMVRPHATAAAFTGGYLAGGVIVGTGLVLLQEIFGLDLLGQDLYTIKGSWVNPEVKQIVDSTPRSENEFDDDF